MGGWVAFGGTLNGNRSSLAAQLLAQVIAELGERVAVIMTITCLPFSEWSQVIPNTRLCTVLLDRIKVGSHRQRFSDCGLLIEDEPTVNQEHDWPWQP